jgi:hypothetical protein
MPCRRFPDDGLGARACPVYVECERMSIDDEIEQARARLAELEAKKAAAVEPDWELAVLRFMDAYCAAAKAGAPPMLFGEYVRPALEAAFPLVPMPAQMGDALPEEPAWIGWHGGECPVPEGTRIEYMIRKPLPAGTVEQPELLRWSHSGPSDDLYLNDIIAYRILPEIEQ